ncbi:MAG: hypothetical protein R2827_11370 [Bdellovibrionales bacterium]
MSATTFAYHGIDSDAVVRACGKVLSETALENIQVSRKVLEQTSDTPLPPDDWRQFWPAASLEYLLNLGIFRLTAAFTKRQIFSQCVL